jgi:hypothetical protein
LSNTGQFKIKKEDSLLPSLPNLLSGAKSPSKAPPIGPNTQSPDGVSIDKLLSINELGLSAFRITTQTD